MGLDTATKTLLAVLSTIILQHKYEINPHDMTTFFHDSQKFEILTCCVRVPKGYRLQSAALSMVYGPNQMCGMFCLTSPAGGHFESVVKPAPLNRSASLRILTLGGTQNVFEGHVMVDRQRPLL